ncbi:MAG: hypothetical protein WBN37_08400 [Arenicellales bacterium]
MVKQYRKFAIDPVRHSEQQKDPEEQLASIQPGDTDQDEGTGQAKTTDDVRYGEQPIGEVGAS